MNAIRALRTEITNVQSGVASSAQSTIGFIDRTLEKQAMLRIGAENSLQLSQDENLSWEQRQRYLEVGLNKQREIVGLQQQSVAEQLKIATEEQEQINLRVKQIELANELNLIDEKALKFAQQRADAEFQVWAARQQMLLGMQAEIIELQNLADTDIIGGVDVDMTLDDARFQDATQYIDRLAEYEIEKASYVGQRIKALELEKNQFIIERTSELLALKYSKEEANAMAVEEANTRFATAETQVRKEIFADYFSAIGELASQGISAIFGNSKNAAIAQVVIDTAMGVVKIWSQAGLAAPLAAFASAGLIAKGKVAIDKIKATNKNTTSMGGDGGGKTMTESSVMNARAADVIRENNAKILSGQSVAESLSPANIMQPTFLVEAKLDRDGLALAVRDGERSIKSQQISYI
jgi:hypothetical protein